METTFQGESLSRSILPLLWLVLWIGGDEAPLLRDFDCFFDLGDLSWGGLLAVVGELTADSRA